MALIEELEAGWQGRVPAPEGCHGWEPYPVASFSRLLSQALTVAPERPSFLDAGCGIGTKVLLATEAGCSASGIELDPTLAAQAQRLGVDVVQADVRGWDYSSYDIVYINCPIRDDGEQAAFERSVYEQMHPGAVVIVVNLAVAPVGWRAIVDEVSAWRGVWVKP